MQLIRKALAARAAAQANVDSARRSISDQSMRDTNESALVEPTPSATPASDSHPSGAASLALPSTAGVADGAPYPRQAWEHVDEILQTLKTTFPLLILSLETMVDQIQHKFKPSPEEDVYRTICMLISEATQV